MIFLTPFGRWCRGVAAGLASLTWAASLWTLAVLKVGLIIAMAVFRLGLIRVIPCILEVIQCFRRGSSDGV